MSTPADQPVRVVIDADGLSARLSIPAGTGIEALDLTALSGAVQMAGVASQAILKDELKRLADAARADPAREHEGVVARGRPPRHGVDGRLELDPAVAPPEAPARGEGAVDHHARSAFTVVRARQLLARVHEPSPGEDGEDVRGNAVRARPARTVTPEHDASIVAEGRELRAAIDGAFSIDGGRLRIVPTLRIDGYVDFSTGNIDFPGEVSVARGVRDGFTLRAGGVLRVAELVEAAQVIAEASAVLERGMAGRDKGTLRVARDLTTRYLGGVDADVGRDLVLEAECTGATVVVGRHVRGPRATVVGGRLVVGGRCELADLGSEGRVATVLELGRRPAIERALQQIEDLLPEVDRDLERIRARLGMLKSSTTKLTAQQAEELTELEFAQSTAVGRRTALYKAGSEAAGCYRRFGASELVIRGVLYPGAKIFFLWKVLEPRECLRGPLALRADERGEPQLEDLSTGDKGGPNKAFRVLPDEEIEWLRGALARFPDVPGQVRDAA